MFPEILTFIRRHWLHLLLFVPGVFLVTLVHESAHAGAAMLQGGTLQRFVWLPSGDRWGFVEYTFPEGSVYSSLAITLAPYGLWLLLMALAGLLSLRFVAGASERGAIIRDVEHSPETSPGLSRFSASLSLQ